MRVLLVDSDQEMVRAVSKDLQEAGFDVRAAATGAGALARHREADVVLLEVSLPDLDGFQVCQRIRSRSSVPIIFHSVKATERDRVLGLKLGADDYVVKPCGTWELAARVEAVLRRARVAEVRIPRQDRGGVAVVGPLRVDLNQRQVEVGGRKVPLTYKEFELLRVLIERPGTSSAGQRLCTRYGATPRKAIRGPRRAHGLPAKKARAAVADRDSARRGLPDHQRVRGRIADTPPPSPTPPQRESRASLPKLRKSGPADQRRAHRKALPARQGVLSTPGADPADSRSTQARGHSGTHRRPEQENTRVPSRVRPQTEGEQQRFHAVPHHVLPAVSIGRAASGPSIEESCEAARPGAAAS